MRNNSQSKYCVAETVRKLARTFGRKKASSAAVAIKFIKKVRETGMLPEIFFGNPRSSTPHRAQLDTSRISLRGILGKDLGLFAYKVQLCGLRTPNVP